MVAIKTYIEDIIDKFNTPDSHERNYYSVVEKLFNSIFENLQRDYKITVEKENDEIGIPDFTIMKSWCDVGIIETKDIKENLDSIKFQEQFTRYIGSKDNVLITNFLEWRWFYKNKEVKRVLLGEIKNENIV